MKTIYQNFDRLRLPLILLVVFIHAQFTAKGMVDTVMPYGIVSHFFTLVISQVAVPLFFCISGCLYFRDYDRFSLKAYIDKQNRRIMTLVVPFFIWNSFFWLLFSGFKMFLPSFMNGGIPSLTDASFKDVVWVYWGNNTGGPIDFPLWFIRDLITITFLSPFVYFILMRFKAGILGLLVLAYLWIFAYPIPVLDNDICKCVFFFSLGGYLNKFLVIDSIRNKMKNALTGGGRFLITTFLLLGILSTINHYIWNNTTVSLITNRFLVIEGLAAMYCVVDRNKSLFDKFKDLIPGDCVFFIFATHGFLITVIKRIIEKMSIDNQTVLIILYFVVVLVTISICVLMYRAIRIVSPKAMKYLTGR